VFVVAQHHGADRVLLEVQRQPESISRELEHFAVLRIAQPVDTGNAVRYRYNRSNVARFRRTVEVSDAIFNEFADFRSLDCHLFYPLIRQSTGQLFQTGTDRAIDDQVICLESGAADQFFVQLKM